jgi:hypothetical protein
MAGQTIGTVNVQVNSQQPSRVTTTIGGRTTLKSASDLTLSGAEDGDVISYIAETNSFQVKSVSALAITKIDGGHY